MDGDQPNAEQALGRLLDALRVAELHLDRLGNITTEAACALRQIEEGRSAVTEAGYSQASHQAVRVPMDEWWRALSPFTEAAADRILSSARKPTADPARDEMALRITVAAVSVSILTRIAKIPPPAAPKAFRADVVRMALRLGKALDAAQAREFAPPPVLPPEWVQQVVDWARKGLQARGRPKCKASRIMYPALLNLFSLAYGVKPTHTKDGPAVRFLSVWLQETKAALAGTPLWAAAAPHLEPPTMSNLLRLIQDWAAPAKRQKEPARLYATVVLALDPSRGVILDGRRRKRPRRTCQENAA